MFDTVSHWALPLAKKEERPHKLNETPTVDLHNVTKRFGDFTAVRDLTLEVGSGEFFTMLGPSGCGKTTTLRMIGGFEQPTAGEILIDGTNVAGLPPFRRPTNTVFQSYALFPHLSVEENVAFGLRRRGVDKAEVRRRVATELDRVGLAPEAKRKPRQLSGGQQQRVALARALVNLPSVLLLDEPLGALDLKLRKGLQIELKNIQRDVGITFVYVTHDQEEALTMSDRIAVMNRGVIEQVDTPEEIYERPRTDFVAGFIGVSNLMPGQVVSRAGNDAEVRLDAGVTVSLRARDGVSAGDGCQVVVRPEKIEVWPLEQPLRGDEPNVEGMVEASVYLGTATQMVIRLAGDTTLTVLVPNTDDAARQQLPGAGARVRLGWLPQHMHLIPAAAAANGSTGGHSPAEEAEIATPARPA
jgi:spermidine/putrescine transport system ATP-binding protein